MQPSLQVQTIKDAGFIFFVLDGPVADFPLFWNFALGTTTACATRFYEWTQKSLSWQLQIHI